jgi:hypothetical protein
MVMGNGAGTWFECIEVLPWTVSVSFGLMDSCWLVRRVIMSLSLSEGWEWVRESVSVCDKGRERNRERD